MAFRLSRRAIVNRTLCLDRKFRSNEFRVCWRGLSLTHIIFMEDYDDLGSYIGDVEHDMWVDYDHYQNTGDPDVFDEEDIDEVID